MSNAFGGDNELVVTRSSCFSEGLPFWGCISRVPAGENELLAAMARHGQV